MRIFSGNSVQSWIFVLVQFACLLIIFMTSPLIAKNPFYLSIEIVGITLGIWAVFLMDPLTINVFPEVRKEASFLKQGPYRIIRHPMYLALILVSSSLLLENYSFFRLIIFLVLLIDLLIKIEYEENILDSNYPDYKYYKAITKKLIPYIY
jgi:protein-S-isoprenylcysteine O-methyltransferase Ste14